MTLTATQAGFGGTTTDAQLSETNFALISAEGGQPYGAPETSGDLLVTAATATLTASIAPGSVVGYGVRVTNSAAANVSFTLPSGTQTRWDLVVIRRDWTGNPGTVAFVVVPGVAGSPGARIMPAARFVGGGVTDDQPLALVQLTGGQPAPTQVVDLRVFPSKQLVAADLLALPTLRGTAGVVGGIQYVRETIGGVDQWVQMGPRRWPRGADLGGITTTPVVFLTSDPIQPGHVLQVSCHTMLQGTLGEIASVQIMANGSPISTARVSLNPTGVAVDFMALGYPTAATVYTLRAYVSAGSHALTVNAGAGNESTLIIEPK